MLRESEIPSDRSLTQRRASSASTDRLAEVDTTTTGKQNTDRRFRWSASCQPGEGLVARGGVEPPTFRFSVGRSYQLSYLAGSDSAALSRGADAGGPDGT